MNHPTQLVTLWIDNDVDLYDYWSSEANAASSLDELEASLERWLAAQYDDQCESTDDPIKTELVQQYPLDGIDCRSLAEHIAHNVGRVDRLSYYPRAGVR